MENIRRPIQNMYMDMCTNKQWIIQIHLIMETVITANEPTPSLPHDALCTCCSDALLHTCGTVRKGSISEWWCVWHAVSRSTAAECHSSQNAYLIQLVWHASPSIHEGGLTSLEHRLVQHLTIIICWLCTNQIAEHVQAFTLCLHVTHALQSDLCNQQIAEVSPVQKWCKGEARPSSCGNKG